MGPGSTAVPLQLGFRRCNWASGAASPGVLSLSAPLYLQASSVPLPRALVWEVRRVGAMLWCRPEEDCLDIARVYRDVVRDKKGGTSFEVGRCTSERLVPWGPALLRAG